MNKEILLYVVEGDEVVSKPLVDIALTPLQEKTIILETYEQHWHDVGVKFHPNTLAARYIQNVDSLYRKFQPLFSRISPGELYDKMLDVDVICAGEEAYVKERGTFTCTGDEEDGDEELDSIAHYVSGEEMVFLLNDKTSLKQVGGSIIHECGHHLHYLYDPSGFKTATSTVKELMAIFTQREFGVTRKYEDGPAGRASYFLDRLEETTFDDLDFKDKWEKLAELRDHKMDFLPFEKMFTEKGYLNYFLEFFTGLSAERWV